MYQQIIQTHSFILPQLINSYCSIITTFMSPSNYKTINTFTRIPSISQIIAYLLIILQTCIFYIMVAPSYQNQITQTTFYALYTAFTVILIITGAICSCIDPSDPVMISCVNGGMKKFDGNLQNLLFCEHCKSYVKKGSRHCRKCDRCVESFDHHCQWINNCVGAKNYKPFFLMILVCSLEIAIFMSSVITLALEDDWQTEYLGFMITSFIVMAIMSIFLLLDFNLFLLHIYLCCKGYSTYDFIMKRREEQKQDEQRKIKEESEKKIEEMKNAREKQLKDLKKRYASLESTPSKVTPKKIYPEPHKQISSNQPILVGEIIDSHFEEVSRGALANSSNQVQEMNHSQISNNYGVFERQEGTNRESSEKASNIENFNHRQEIGSSGTSHHINEKSENNEEIHNSSNSIQISQYFIRSKSLKLMVDGEEAYVPTIKAINCSDIIKTQKLAQNDNMPENLSLHLSKNSFTKGKNISSSQMPRLNDRLPAKKKLKALTSLGPNSRNLYSNK